MLAHQIPIILGGFSPSLIFSELRGSWLEPQIGQMWRENNGINPTVSAGQTIGLILGMDEGQPPIPSNELIVNGDGSTMTGWWTSIASGCSITPVGGEFRFISTGNATQMGQTILTSGRFYSVAFSYRVVSGMAKFSLGGVTEYMLTGTGTVSSIVRADGTQFFINRVAGVASEFYIDNVSVREIPGNHASQATAANRPTLQYDRGLALVRCDSNDFMTVSLPDLGGGVFSSSGSVYFALPTGMSALHGQSIGTSYSAPIQSMDLYSVVIVPSRLSDQREAQLQTYFEKLAGLR